MESILNYAIIIMYTITYIVHVNLEARGLRSMHCCGSIESVVYYATSPLGRLMTCGQREIKLISIH